MNKGTKVRVKADPARVGFITGQYREIAGRKKWEVDFNDGTVSHYLETALEEVKNKEDPLILFEHGKLGRAEDLRTHLTYIRLNGRLANLIYSMETTNTDFYPYQFKPVLDFLESVSNGLLIADEVGLGKTIEAGLIWTELRSRFDVRRLLVVCPAMLREKWQNELELRFGINTQIADANEVLDILEKQKTGKKPFALIASMQGLRPKKEWNSEEEPAQNNSSKLARFIKENEEKEPLIDLLIIDEAHYLRNPESMTSQLGQLLRHISEYILLLSATPINLKNKDLYQLLNLVDEDTFYNQYVFEHILQANAPLIKARDKILREKITQAEIKELLQQAQQHYLLKDNNQLKSLLDNLPTTEQLDNNDFRSQLAQRLENINLLSKAITRTRKRDVQEWRVVRDVIPEYIEPTDIELEFYTEVTNFLRQYCIEHQIPHGFLLATPQRQISSSMPAALQAWREKILFLEEQLYEDIGYDEELNNHGVVIQQLIKLSQQFDLDNLKKHDSKYKRLKEKLQDYIKHHPKEKIILFAYFRPTLAYLQQRLEDDGIECKKLIGGMADNKQEFIDHFKESNAKVLLLSEVASEGIDLQFCHVLINYDLPWNPMKVEQRIGRIDRLGQKSPKIIIWNLFYRYTIDARIYERLFERLNIFQYALGDLEEVLGQEIKDLTNELMITQLTPEQEEKRIEQTTQALANLQQQNEKLEAEAINLVAHGDYILNQVKAAKELNRFISNDDIYVFINDFLVRNYTGCEFKQLKETELIFDIRLSEQAKVDLTDFIKQRQLEGYTRLAFNEHKAIRCQFENKVGGKISGNKPEIISQFHPLTRFVAYRIQQNIKNGDTIFYPVIAVKLSSHYIENLSLGTYVFYSQAWTIKGLRDIEKIYFSAKSLTDNLLTENLAEHLITQAALYGEDWLEAINLVNLKLVREQLVEFCMIKTEEEYDNYIEQLQNENEDRANLQKNSIISHRDRQIEKRQAILREKGSQWRLKSATEAQINNIKNKSDYKLTEIDKKRQLNHSANELALGIIYIY